MRVLRTSAFVLALSASSLAALSVAQAQPAITVSVDVAPPPLPAYEQPVVPGDDYIWIPGYWAWDQSVADYYWVPGTWAMAPEPGLLWTPAYWAWNDGAYVFYDGYWGQQVGFYGGIDYGYGYTGDGYEGGRWDHGHFFYNRAANNLAGVSVRNVYNETIAVNETNRVSFNGGDGGIKARPSAQQEAFAKQRHIEATSAQSQQREAAMKNRALFAKQNHGEPEIAATERPGAFTGKGVTHATHTAARPDDNKPAGAATKANGEAKPATTNEARKPNEEQKPGAAMKNEARKPNEEQTGEKPGAAMKNEARRPNEEQTGEKPGAAMKNEARKPVEEQRAERPAAAPDAKSEMRRPAEGQNAERPAAAMQGEKPQEGRAAMAPAPKPEMKAPAQGGAMHAQPPHPKPEDPK